MKPICRRQGNIQWKVSVVYHFASWLIAFFMHGVQIDFGTVPKKKKLQTETGPNSEKRPRKAREKFCNLHYPNSHCITSYLIPLLQLSYSSIAAWRGQLCRPCDVTWQSDVTGADDHEVAARHGLQYQHHSSQPVRQRTTNVMQISHGRCRLVLIDATSVESFVLRPHDKKYV